LNEPDDFYIQVFRTGAVEFTADIYVRDEKAELTALEDRLLQGIDLAFRLQRPLAVTPPLVVMVSLVNPERVRLAGARDLLAHIRRIFEEVDLRHKILDLPDVWVESFDSEPRAFMRPIFSVLWNTVGLRKSVSYDDGGNWIKETRP
jgi:hypothetical protein